MRRGWLLAAFLTAAGTLGIDDTIGSAEAATVRALSPGQLAERSTLIFIGTVERQASRFVSANNHVVTDTVFRVEQVVKGDKHQTTFSLTQLGGTVGEGRHQRATHVPGYARFTAGERVVLFLEPTTTGRLVPTGLSQGKYRLKTDRAGGETMAFRDLDGLHVVGRGPVMHLMGAPQNPNRLTLQQLLAIVRGERPTAPVSLEQQLIRDLPNMSTAHEAHGEGE